MARVLEVYMLVRVTVNALLI